MKIINYPSLDSTSLINSISISSNQLSIAFGDSNKQLQYLIFKIYLYISIQLQKKISYLMKNKILTIMY